MTKLNHWSTVKSTTRHYLHSSHTRLARNWATIKSKMTPTFDADEMLDFTELVKSRGFTLQAHSVTTEDGYILLLHRVVPNDFTDSVIYGQTRKPVIVNHGLVASSNNFFITSKELTSGESKYGDNFGFSLLLTGRYDVWLPNNRGNGYSMKHTQYSTWNPKFWKFSFQQMAQYDLPVVIDYIKKETGHETLNYIGHSQGLQLQIVSYAFNCV